MLVEIEINNVEDELNDVIDYVSNELKKNKEQIIEEDNYIEINVDIEQDNGEYINIEIRKSYYEGDAVDEFKAKNETFDDEELKNHLKDRFECLIDEVIDELREKIENKFTDNDCDYNCDLFI